MEVRMNTINNLISRVTSVFSTSASDRDMEMKNLDQRGKLGDGPRTVSTGNASDPKARFGSANWHKIISLPSRFLQWLQSSESKPQVKPRAEVKSLADPQMRAAAQAQTKAHSRLFSEAKKEFSAMLDHVYQVAVRSKQTQKDFSKAIESFKRFKHFIDSAPNKNHVMAQIVNERFGRVATVKDGHLLLQLQPTGMFHQQLESADLQNFLGLLVTQAEEFYNDGV
jgi:hypothetical protein